MCEPFVAALRLLAIWLALALVFCGLGFHVRRLFGLRCLTVRDLFLTFWSGWVLVLVILQVWHLWLPVDVRALAAIAVLGGAGVIREKGSLGILLGHRSAAAGVLLLGLGTAALALGPLKYFDTGLYHLTTLEWIRTYPIVPGLGNLFGRLAYNSSFYLYAALLETVWTDGARYLANSLVMFVLLVQTLLDAARYLRARRGHGDPLHLPDLVSTLLLGPIVAQMLSQSFSSLSSDMPVFALGIVVTLSVIRLSTRAPGSPREGLYHLFTIVLLVTGSLTVKLSFLVYGGLMVMLALVFWWRGSPRSRAGACLALVLMSTLGAAVLVPWAVRSVYLSGYVVYPGGHLPVPVDWRVPRALALDEANVIYGFARDRTEHWVAVLGNRSWLGHWWSEQSGSTGRYLAVMVLTLCALAARLLKRPWRDPPPGGAAVLLVVLASLVSLTWWFSTVPDPRFAGALFAILAAGLGALALPIKGRTVIDLVAAAVFLAILGIPNEDVFNPPAYCRSPDWDYVTRTTDSGLTVHVPAHGIQCWEFPLPSTPDFRSSLSLRRPGDLAQGFFLEKTVTLAGIKGGPIPLGFSLSPDLGLNLVSGWRQLHLSDNRRLMSGDGRLLLYTERSTRARLRLSTRSIARQGEPLESCELKLLVGGARVHRSELRPGLPIEIEILLTRDFNDIVLETSAGEEPEDLHPVFRHARRIEVTFDEIEIRSKPEGGEGSAHLGQQARSRSR